jgi:TetR/AcrR family transcriptional regulator
VIVYGTSMFSTVGAEVWPAVPEERPPRQRILAAMAAEAAECGYVDSTVRRVSTRAGVSTKTFYGEFANRLDCFLATVDDAVDHAASLAAAAARGHDPYEGFRRGLDAVLGFLADEPALARVCLVELLAVPDAGGARRRSGIWATS